MNRCIRTSLFLLIFSLTAAFTLAQTTAFTYQGNLDQDGGPANGTYDFEFALYDALDGGNQIGATITKTGVEVANGSFSVVLDFGDQFFRLTTYLEVRVRLTAPLIEETEFLGSFTTLTPRSRLWGVPYSQFTIRAAFATTAARLGGVDASEYVLTTDPRLTDARTPTAGSNDYIQNGTSQQVGNFNISGTGRVGFNFTVGERFTADTVQAVSSFRLGVGSGRVVIRELSPSSLFVGIRAGALVSGFSSGNSFFGFQAGEDSSSGEWNSFFGLDAGKDNVSGDYNTFVGTSSGTTNLSGNRNTLIGSQTDVGSDALNFATAIGAGAVVTSSNRVQIGRDGFDAVRIGGLSSSGSTSICLNTAKELSFCSSSLRYKENLESFGGGLELLSRLRPVTFDWNDTGVRDLGLVAEEVAEIDPLLVTFNSNGKVEGVKYDRIGLVLLNVVKEQQQEIASLTDEVQNGRKVAAGQKNELNSLRAELLSERKKAQKRQDELESLAAELAALKALVCSGMPEALGCRTRVQEMERTDPKQNREDSEDGVRQ